MSAIGLDTQVYAEDRWQNPLCFVEAGTLYPG